jgi:outer membrane protein assembly factor BamA
LISPKYLLCIAAVLSYFKAFPQQNSLADNLQNVIPDTTSMSIIDSSKQVDIIDVIQNALDKNISGQKRQLPKKANYAIIPYAGYTLSTGFTADVSGNVGFYTSENHRENLSVLAADVGYDSKSQKSFITRSEIWADDNDLKIVTDLRWQKYPTDTYGLGTFTTFAKDNDLDFLYVRVYETVLKKIAPDYYAGIGYNLDYHYDITATGNLDNTVSDFTKYGQTASSRSSAVNFDFLYDNRKNPINPLSGTFASVIYRENLMVLGSDANWRSLNLDFRKYIKLSSRSNNVLAIWGIAAFTSGNAPYLDLPATGTDMYNNSGRGYAIGRFRGANELYLEGEYRFGITRNGILGAVLFANGESFSGLQKNSLEGIAPAAGTGVRIKLNKHSNTNICIDYGVGAGSSRGFFVNLGELF